MQFLVFGICDRIYILVILIVIIRQRDSAFFDSIFVVRDGIGKVFLLFDGIFYLQNFTFSSTSTQSD